MESRPLCVDCDGVLVRTDLLHEGMLRLVKRRPWQLALLPFWRLGGRARFGAEVARRVALAPELLPYNTELLERLRAEHAAGRQLLLLSTAPEAYARQVAAHLGLFADVHPAAQDSTTAVAKIERAFPFARPDLRVILRALRVHQWLKNLLIFVPLVVSHRISEPALIRAAFIAFFCFSLLASAVYVVNDLLDLESDRQHPRKRFRPFAAGLLGAGHGLLLIVGCLAAVAALATLVPLAFGLTLAAYLVLTTAYTFALKNRAIVDVLLLAGLYTVRIVAGAAATAIMPSFWLLALSMFLFLSLAVVKRYAEILVASGDGKSSLAGRGYVITDLPLLGALGVASGVVAVLVVALYVNSQEVHELYAEPQLLWLLPLMLLYWICRVWLKTHRGQMHDDPLLFAARDRPSLVTGACILSLLVLASYG